MLLAFYFFFYFNFGNSQVNYVSNPSFEQLDSLNDIVHYITLASPWDSLKAGGGGANIADQPSSFTNYQLARTGKEMAYMVYFVNSPPALSARSYIQQPLNKKLVAGKSYCVTHYANLANRCQYAVDELGVYFDDGTIASILPGREAITNPQVKSPAGIFFSDTLGWMKIQGTFTANGTESYITLGNFKSYAAATYSFVYPLAPAYVTEYYVDDVSVIEADLPAYAGRDTVICSGDSIFIGRPPEIGLECAWSSGTNTIGSGGGLWVKPAATQTFMVSQDVCGIIKADTIKVQVKPKYTGPNISLSTSSATTCPGNTVVLTATNNPPGTNSYNWLPVGVFTQTASITASASVSQNTTFTLTINNDGQNAFCPFQRSANVSVSVPVYTDSPSISFNPVVCPDDTINFSILNAAPGNTVSYQWLPSVAFVSIGSLTAKGTIPQSTNFTVSITSSGNASLCPFVRTLTASISVPDSCFHDPQIPNIFTPNGDNVNDFWEIKFPNGYSLNELQVFNRWGTLIYERGDLNFEKQAFARIGWDGYTTSGNQCTAGVYFYIVKYTDRSGILKSFKGNVSLIK